MLMPSISQYMTREPYSIPSTSSAATARAVMQSHLVRHLPILDGPEVVGLVAAAELDAMCKVTDLDNISVTRVMRKPVTVWGSSPLDEVAELMSEAKCDCVVVLGGHGVQGIFTATDALRALATLLQRAAG
jgi:CBS domain-containing protein